MSRAPGCLSRGLLHLFVSGLPSLSACPWVFRRVGAATGALVCLWPAPPPKKKWWRFVAGATTGALVFLRTAPVEQKKVVAVCCWCRDACAGLPSASLRNKWWWFVAALDISNVTDHGGDSLTLCNVPVQVLMPVCIFSGSAVVQSSSSRYSCPSASLLAAHITGSKPAASTTGSKRRRQQTPPATNTTGSKHHRRLTPPARGAFHVELR